MDLRAVVGIVIAGAAGAASAGVMVFALRDLVAPRMSNRMLCATTAIVAITAALWVTARGLPN